MFFNSGFRGTNQPFNNMNNPFYQNNNMNRPNNMPFIPNLLNPERPFANDTATFNSENSSNTQAKAYINPQLKDYLQQFIQDEKNASYYYERLAEKTEIEKNKKLLYSISSNALEEINHAKKFCSSYSISLNEPIEKSVNTLVTFSGGVALALEEENNALNKFSSMLDNENSEANSKLTPFILRKLSRINNLYLIYYNLID